MPSSSICPRRPIVRRSQAHDPDKYDARSSSARPTTTSRSAALAFKIMTDPFVGTLTFIRVYSGVLNSGDSVLQLALSGKNERIGRMVQMHANERSEIKEVRAGDIAACVGI